MKYRYKILKVWMSIISNLFFLIELSITENFIPCAKLSPHHSKMPLFLSRFAQGRSE